MGKFLDKLDETGAETIDSIKNYLEQGVDFVQEQAPLYIQELLAYAFYDHCIMVMMFVLIFAGGLLGSLILIKYSRSMDRDSSEYVLSMFLGATFLTLTLIAVPVNMKPVHHLKQAIKVKVAPRVYIVDEIRGYNKEHVQESNK